MSRCKNFLVIMLGYSSILQAQSIDTSIAKTNINNDSKAIKNAAVYHPKLILNFPVIDLPFLSYPYKTNFATNNTWLNPGMKQTLEMSSDLYFTTHYYLKKLIWKNKKETTQKILYACMRPGLKAIIHLYIT